MQLNPLFTFLAGLAKNNERPWFQERKAAYDQLRTQFEEDAGFWFRELAKLDPALAGPEGRKSIFRVYRDVRFSKNKDPYKTHFSVYFTASPGKEVDAPGYYVQLGPNGNTPTTPTNSKPCSPRPISSTTSADWAVKSSKNLPPLTPSTTPKLNY